MSKKKKLLIGILIVLVLIFLAAQVVMKKIESNLNGLMALELADIDLDQTKDGVFTGSHSALPVEAEVQVELKNHKIVSIELIEHKHGQGANAEILPEIVLQAQSLDVDLVVGASYSSKVILKAIEDALMQAVEQ
ncbi:MAG: FMN-binding protein [Acidaminobacter sp.]|uniref:FMN-binding protein n=1 Tax=Acidaminobacter sp. TaxID=1872102 RepID=UPI0013862E35|nr:FMN-binding protein [Acidaminobacter sp.]MZQ96358.1 FMN-binding protein [Acidaminobacter sp.]